MALAKFAIMIELRKDGKLYLNAANNDLPKDAAIMQLKGLIAQLEKDYFDDALRNRIFADSL